VAEPVGSYADFARKFRILRHTRDLFLFLLYDSGGWRNAIKRYVDKRFAYLDELANASRTFIFLFTPRETGSPHTRNPGPAVAANFGIRPNQLPGVLVFCLADDGRSFGNGAYFPLEKSLFRKNPNAIDDAFADLFSMIQDVAESETTPREQISALQRRIKRRQQAHERGPLIAALKAGSISAIAYAGRILLAMAPAWHR
jgi:hypothetical protein